jgi:hypothetical protein
VTRFRLDLEYNLCPFWARLRGATGKVGKSVLSLSLHARIDIFRSIRRYMEMSRCPVWTDRIDAFRCADECISILGTWFPSVLGRFGESRKSDLSDKGLYKGVV